MIGDEFYVDVDEKIYDFVRPGFLVAMNMNEKMAMDVLMQRQEVLKTVKAESEKEEERVDTQSNQEAAAKRQRALEMDRLREQSRISIQRDRARYFDYYGRRRFR